MFCRVNEVDVPEFDDAQLLNAVSSAAEDCSKRHNDACYLFQTSGLLLMCDRCLRVTNPVFSQLRGIPVGEWRRGVCTGLNASDVGVAKIKAKRAAVTD